MTQAMALICATIALCTTISILIELTMHTSSILCDVKSTFNQIDRLTEDKNYEKLSIEICKEAVILHDRINR